MDYQVNIHEHLKGFDNIFLQCIPENNLYSHQQQLRNLILYGKFRFCKDALDIALLFSTVASNLLSCPQARCLAPHSFLPYIWPFYLALVKLSKLLSSLTSLPKILPGCIYIPSRSVKKPHRNFSLFSGSHSALSPRTLHFFLAFLSSALKGSLIFPTWHPEFLFSHHLAFFLLFQCKVLWKKALSCWKSFPHDSTGPPHLGISPSPFPSSHTHPPHPMLFQAAVVCVVGWRRGEGKGAGQAEPGSTPWVEIESRKTKAARMSSIHYWRGLRCTGRNSQRSAGLLCLLQ